MRAPANEPGSHSSSARFFVATVSAMRASVWGLIDVRVADASARSIAGPCNHFCIVAIFGSFERSIWGAGFANAVVMTSPSSSLVAGARGVSG